jgi:hypothetical protein
MSTWNDSTLDELQRKVLNAEINAGIERDIPSSDSETQSELDAAMGGRYR